MDIELPYSKSLDLRLLALGYVDSLRGGSMGAPDTSGACLDVVQFDQALGILRQAHEAADGDWRDVTISEGAAPYRFFMALAASTHGVKIRLHAGKRLSERPIGPLAATLNRIGGDVKRTNAATFEITGKRLRGGAIAVDTRMTSQFLSALLLSSPLWENGIDLDRIPNDFPSRPYFEMTRRMVEGYMKGRPIPPRERDWSAAAFFVEGDLLARHAGLPFPRLDFPGLPEPGQSLQGDSRTVALAQEWLVPAPFEMDMEATPDLVLPFAFLCGLGGKEFRFSGVANLRLKESDRLEALKSELEKFGCRIEIGPDTLSGLPAMPSRREIPVEVDPHGDHRMAMAAAMARFGGWKCNVADPQVVAKSFPGFWQQLGLLDCWG